MLLAIVFALIRFGSSFRIESVCYGQTYEVPEFYTTTIYFQPRDEGRMKVINEKGESEHKRFVVHFGNVKMKYLTEKDDGAMLFLGRYTSVELDVKDCQSPYLSLYGDAFSLSVPDEAEYLEFAHVPPRSSIAHLPVVLWNRTGFVSARGMVKNDMFEITKLKQKDSGYYKFIGAADRLVKWKKLRVEEHFQYLPYSEGDNIEMMIPATFPVVHVKHYPPEGGSDYILIERRHKDPRVELSNSYLAIRQSKPKDAGTYWFMDNEGFLVLRVQLEEKIASTPTWVYWLVCPIVLFCLLFCCCCCVRKCCCKKDSTNSPETEPPPVYYHDPPEPTQSVIPLVSREPRVDDAEPSPYNPTLCSMDLPSHTQVPASGGVGPTFVIPNSSDTEQMFEYVRTFPGAPPLSAETSSGHVYTSDKLNFL